MSKISGIDLGSAVLSICIVAGFIATAFVFIRLTVIGINYLKINYSKDQLEDKDTDMSKGESKGF
tara:strand:+ start:1614 stop:1808 length:195 start_codon:yes stop_codon:yes gene_type:complete